MNKRVEHCLMATLMRPNMEMMMTNKEKSKGNSPATGDSQYLKSGGDDRNEKCIAWIVQIFHLLHSTKIPNSTTAGAVRIKSADYTC
jgi:hypothetical protein